MNAQHPVHTMPSSGLARPAPQIAAHGPTWANARESDFRIIGEHLRKASQSNKLATHLHAQGQCSFL